MFDTTIANDLYKFFLDNEFNTILIKEKDGELNNQLQSAVKSNPEIIIIDNTNKKIISEEKIDVLINTSSQNNLNNKESTIINIDTNNIKNNKIEIIIKILISMRKKYIEEFKIKYDLN